MFADKAFLIFDSRSVYRPAIEFGQCCSDSPKLCNGTGIMNVVSRLSHFIHARFIWLLIGSYMVAAFFPTLGLAVRSLHWGTINLPMVMLGFLLFNAGMGVELSALKKLSND